MKKNIRYVTLEESIREHLKDPEYRKWYEYYGRKFEYSMRLAALRKKQGMSQAKLAEAAGTKQSVIARIESGDANPTFDTMINLGIALGKKCEVRYV